ncbi:hypothetical protein IWQ56_004247 [Coemansia nantahalensis]|uniref:Uncharacterized protein n=2 Tax=Coemansia TaxID=4863 RepID=A0ACC1KT27_9FUNG|nr:hypothetical protein IWQ56_004247 [Coemansia nantahalensis]KAJ2765575.1 hypothetical protein IWQ57_004723 [Coemansia nantahalensis]KAJ2794457.1 hypothetical protein H4R21_005493 [Coemansia helicoidea]
MGPVSAEVATKVVDDIIGSISIEAMRAQPRLDLSDAEKKVVRESLPGLEGLLAGNRQVMRAVYMLTQNRELVARAYSAEVAVAEQRRLLGVDQYIIRPENVNQIFGILQKTISLAKEWGLAQQNPGAAAGAPAPADPRPPALHSAAAHLAAPMTNMHPDAVTSDPTLENFHKAVKHPLDPGSLRLPVTKKRAVGKSNAPGSDSQTPTVPAPAPTMLPQPAPAAFVPAPMMLPPNMTRDEFDRLPLDKRTSILKNQQTALIRQQTIGIESVAAAAAATAGTMPGGSSTNPLLMAAERGMSSGGSLLSEEERRLQALEKDKWNRPLEYLMCVLDRFTASAERAGVEPAPILQQAFWPIARRSGVIATDAVL